MPRPLRLRWKLVLCIAVLALADVTIHVRRFAVPRPDTNLDPPFHVGCQEPVLNGSARARAALVMLARNADLGGAVASVRNVQQQFNRHFGYPWVFLNDEPWSREFVAAVGDAVAEDAGGAAASFETIPADMWGYPDWVDRDEARRRMLEMQSRGVKYAGKESYHHMCRFNSGFFYDHPALSDYKWYWRVEPDISLTCAVTYDPFVEMERHGKRYGYTMALKEIPATAPSLFGRLARYRADRQIPASPLWTAMTEPSWLPWPLRRLRGRQANRDGHGDAWNLCHFWSNFEIAHLDFFRSPAYRDLFAHLDGAGGFYYERWGDAPVHSLAVALLLPPRQVHHFADVGYVHDTLQYCTHGPTPAALRRGELVPGIGGDGRGPELGCRCNCANGAGVIRPVCFNRLRRTVM
ncbi:glycolipid 2-alpha-mannosyltransferase [Hirsutella rhossiliensis]